MGNDVDSQTHLERLELLKSFKERLVVNVEWNETPFQHEQVVGYNTDTTSYDVPDIHSSVRKQIDIILSRIHGGQQSQVVILAGAPGMGKSHLLNSYRRDASIENGKYIFVCNSNHWRVQEFEECLLDWMIQALTDPQQTSGDLLLEKVKDIAFRALQQVATEPGMLRKYLIPGSSIRSLWDRVTGSEETMVRTMIEERNLQILNHIQYRVLANTIAERFLRDSSNPFHRYVVMVLLRYLYPSDREYVLHWLRGKTIEPAFFQSMGITDHVDRKYKCIDVIKILVSLFTSVISNRLKGAQKGSIDGRVFFLAFDQAEAREGLFQTAEDWTTFFTQLSEIYNTLPNVFVLFTMTIALREKYASRMEKQFKDRILQSDDFILREISDDDLKSLYQSRLRKWLQTDPLLLEKYEQCGNPYFPFAQADILGELQRKTLRNVLDILDKRFGDLVSEVEVAIETDYLVARNKHRVAQDKLSAIKYVADHLTVLESIMQSWGEVIGRRYGLWFEQYAWNYTLNNTPCLCLRFHDLNHRKRWVQIWIVMLSHQYTEKVSDAMRLLQNLKRDQNYLWLMRADKLNAQVEANRQKQVELHEFKVNHHTELMALRDILSRRDRYIPSVFANGCEYLFEQFQQTYLHALFTKAGNMLNQLSTESESDAGDVGGGNR